MGCFPKESKSQNIDSFSYLHDRVPPCGGFHGPPAPLRLIVSSVVRLGLHLDAQLVLVGAPGDRPLQRGKGGHGDAERHKFTEER